MVVRTKTQGKIVKIINAFISTIALEDERKGSTIESWLLLGAILAIQKFPEVKIKVSLEVGN